MAPSEDLAIVPLAGADAEACLALSDEAGWNQTQDDWRLFIENGRTFGIRDAETRLVATAAALPYEENFGFISMVLVTSARRREGLATRLVDLSIDHLRGQRLVPVLDATPTGETVYAKQGFRSLFSIERWQGRSEGGSAASDIKDDKSSDLTTVVALDAEALGAPRGAILAGFLDRAGSRAFVSPGGTGFALIRAGRKALQLGPIVAGSVAEALKLLGSVLTAARGTVFIDVPVRQRDIGEMLARHGFTRQRSFSRMAYGSTMPFGKPERLFAVAGPEFG
ncbi:MAG: GNAT family N-acetyltransferase [Rhizobiaceae bacterium]|nr:MAG: GNAT family N-acetyltransferase [Rhizobiaceae bacterium]